MSGRHRKAPLPNRASPASCSFAQICWLLLDTHICLRRQSHFLGQVLFLKFLVTGKGIDYGGPLDPAYFVVSSEKIILPSIEMIKDWEEKKIIVGGLFAGQRAGVMIIEAASGEELSSWMQRLPFWALNTWEVIPLQSFQSGVEDVKVQISNAKKMMEMSVAPKPKYESAPI